MKRNNLKNFKKGKRSLKGILKFNIWTHIKFFLYLLASLIAKILLVFYPVSKIIDFNLVQEINELHVLNAEKIFKNTKPNKKLWDLLLLHTIKVFIIMAELIFVAAIGYFIYFGIDFFNQIVLLNMDLIAQVIAIPIIILGLFFALIIAISFDFSAHILLSSEEMPLEKALSKGKSLMTKKEIANLISFSVLQLLPFIILGGISFGITYLIFVEVSIILSVILGFLLAPIILCVFVKNILSIKIAYFNFYSNILEKSEKVLSDNKENSKVEKEKILIDLFNQTLAEEPQ